MKAGYFSGEFPGFHLDIIGVICEKLYSKGLDGPDIGICNCS